MAVLKVEAGNFKEETKSGFVLVDFYADWCGPCQALSPVLDILTEAQDKVKIVKVNVDTDPSIAQEYGVMSMPTLLMLKDGVKVDQKVGLLSKDDLETWFTSL